jgi:DNA topoisomerase-1
MLPRLAPLASIEILTLGGPGHTRMGKRAKKSTKAARKPKAAKAARRPRAGGGRSLVVVESPAKARTINRYLGSGYVVKASMGHVRDLPPKEMGVDVENDFAPTYEPLREKRKVLAELRKAVKSAGEVFLATDLDREGEAIAWHLSESLGAGKRRIRRVIFNEITAAAIREAFAHPQDIDMNKVNAQQARRILDRLVGYKISPLLWKKVAAGLSAGRVQSVAVRLIVDREREIDAFVPEEYWKIGAVFARDQAAATQLAGQWARFLSRKDEKGNLPSPDARQQFLQKRKAFQAELVRWKGERPRIASVDEAVEIAKALGLEVREIRREEDPKGKGPARNLARVVGVLPAERPEYQVRDVNQRQSRSRPSAPFTTASLQQTAAVQVRFHARQTMRIAQNLYEGVEVPREGSVGLITYMRTDSTRLSAEALNHVRSYIGEQFGAEYVPEKPNVFAPAQRAQEAHEAIRPTDVRRHPEQLRSALREDHYKLYKLIWNRFVACQMPAAVWNVTEADIVAETSAGEAVFKAMGRTLAFDGYLRVAGMPKSGEQILPELRTGQTPAPAAIHPTQHFTQAPPRYTEASLVKALEADGIGRPSTYATIIQTIQDRQYVKLVDRAFRPTDLGAVVTDKLVKHFPRILDVHFTAEMEDELDKIEDSEVDWVTVLRRFYGPFADSLERAAENMVHAKAETQPSEYACEACGRPMVYRFSKNGRYLACTGYPECRQTHPVDDQGRKAEKQAVDVACPACGKTMLLRQGRYGPFLSCSDYPDCKGTVNLDRKGCIKRPSAPPLKVDIPCPKCGSPMNLRRSRRGPWLSCSTFPKCRGRVGWTTLDEDKRSRLEKELAEHEKANPVPLVRHLDGSPIPPQTKPTPLTESSNKPPQGKPDPS